MNLLKVCLILFFLTILFISCNNNPISGGNSGWIHCQGLEGFGPTGFGASGQTLLAGTSCGPCSQAYVYRSTDNGLTWVLQQSFEVVTSNPVVPLYLYPHVTFINDGTLLFSGVGNVDYGQNTYVSTDNGRTWTDRDTNFVQVINCLTTIGQTIFAGTNRGVFLSSDGGKSWVPSDSSGLSAPVNGLVAIRSVLFAATSGEGIYRSSNSGQSWIEINPTTSAFTGLATVGDILFWAGLDTSSGGGLFSSTDEGGTWTRIWSLPGDRLYSLCTSDVDIFAVTDSGVFASFNSGKIWTDISPSVALSSVRAFAVENQNLLVGTDGNGAWLYPLR